MCFFGNVSKTMKPTRKKEKLSEPPASQLTILDLNDDCIFHILWNLSSSDLCSMSITCKRLRKLSFDHYPRQYPDERITIGSVSWSHSNKPNNQLIKKNFRKCIRNIRIESWGTQENLQHLLDFVDAKSCADWQTFELDIGGLLKEVHTKSIRNRLQNLSSLIITSPHVRLDIHNALLKYCENLECLELQFHSSFDTFWMTNKYPTIKTLCIALMSPESEKSFAAFAMTFFQLNPQIQSIRCLGIENGTNWLEVLRTVHIERLALIPVYANITINCIKELICHTKENKIKWLHLRIRYESEDEICTALADLNAVQPISELEYILTGFHDELTWLSQLKSVQRLTLESGHNYEISDELWDVLSKQLPNLRDLQICLEGYNGLDFKWMTMQFIQHSLKIKRLTFINCSTDTFTFHPTDMVQLNECRSKLSCASPVWIQCKFNGDSFVTPVFICPSIRSVVDVKFTKILFEYREVRC